MHNYGCVDLRVLDTYEDKYRRGNQDLGDATHVLGKALVMSSFQGWMRSRDDRSLGSEEAGEMAYDYDDGSSDGNGQSRWLVGYLHIHTPQAAADTTWIASIASTL
jgi:hypothetical protein